MLFARVSKAKQVELQQETLRVFIRKSILEHLLCARNYSRYSKNNDEEYKHYPFTYLAVEVCV